MCFVYLEVTFKHKVTNYVDDSSVDDEMEEDDDENDDDEKSMYKRKANLSQIHQCP